MKWIFLDIDGVLATNKEFWTNTQNFHKKHEWAAKLRVPYPWNPDAVKVFNEILEATGAEIIISSDWKLHWSMDDLATIFKENGVIKAPIDKTGHHPVSMSILEKNRASDIEAYIRDNNFIEGTDETPTCMWIVIDDLAVGRWFPEHLKDRVFRTEDNEGMKKSGLKEKIIKKLNEYDTKM